VVEEAAFRARRLGVHAEKRVRAGRHPGREIVRELEGGRYELVVVGTYDHGSRGRVYLGTTVEALVTPAARRPRSSWMCSPWSCAGGRPAGASGWEGSSPPPPRRCDGYQRPLAASSP
jgi:hypothetical protein